MLLALLATAFNLFSRKSAKETAKYYIGVALSTVGHHWTISEEEGAMRQLI